MLRLSGAFSLLRIRHVRVNPHNLILRTGILVLTVCRVMRARISQWHASVSCLHTISFTTTIMSINYLIRDSLLSDLPLAAPSKIHVLLPSAPLRMMFPFKRPLTARANDLLHKDLM